MSAGAIVCVAVLELLGALLVLIGSRDMAIGHLEGGFIAIIGGAAIALPLMLLLGFWGIALLAVLMFALQYAGKRWAS